VQVPCEVTKVSHCRDTIYERARSRPEHAFRYTLGTVDEFSAAHHEAAHAVAAVRFGLPLQDTGLHLDTVDGGITFNLHRKPGDPNNTPADVEERERSIVMIKAGYIANLKLFPNTPAAVASDDRKEEIALLNEMYAPSGQQWMNADSRLTGEAQSLVDKHWDAIRALAQAVVAKPVAPRSRESFQKWSSPYPNEKYIDGYEIASILKDFGLNAIVRNESEGIYLSPDIHPKAK
jgi:hypothetical protein